MKDTTGFERCMQAMRDKAYEAAKRLVLGVEGVAKDTAGGLINSYGDGITTGAED